MSCLTAEWLRERPPYLKDCTSCEIEPSTYTHWTQPSAHVSEKLPHPAHLTHDIEPDVKPAYILSRGQRLTYDTYAVPKQVKTKRPLRCSVTGCTYDKPFSRQYELTRHMMTIHHVAMSGNTYDFYECAVADCPTKPRLWARRDKFVAHTRGAHPELKEDDHIQASIVSYARVRSLAEQASQEEASFGNINEVIHQSTRGYLSNMPFSVGSVSQQPSLWAHTSIDSTVKHEQLLARSPSAAGPGAVVHADDRTGRVIINPIPQQRRHHNIRDTIAQVDAAFPRTEAHDLHTFVSTLPRPATAPLAQFLASSGSRTRRSSWSESSSSYLSDTQSLHDGDSYPHGQSTGGFIGLPYHEAEAYGTGSHQQPRKTSPGQHEFITTQASSLRKRRRLTPELGPFPCVFHKHGHGTDPTLYCRNRQNFVSYLRKHHECASHPFFYCATCFIKFTSRDARDAHDTRSNPCSRFKCVTDGCEHFGRSRECQHALGRNGNTQYCTWRALFRLARPDEQIPDLPVVDEPAFSPSAMSPPTPTGLAQPLAAVATPYLQTPTAVSPDVQMALESSEIAPSPRSATLALPDATSPTGLLRARVQELQRLDELLLQEMDSSVPDRFPVLQAFYNSTIANHITSTPAEDDHSGDLRRRICSLENLARELWRHRTTPWDFTEASEETLRLWASGVLGDREPVLDARLTRPQASLPLRSPLARAYTAVVPGFQVFPTPADASDTFGPSTLDADVASPSLNTTFDFSDTSQFTPFTAGGEQSQGGGFAFGQDFQIPAGVDMLGMPPLQEDNASGTQTQGSRVGTHHPFQTPAGLLMPRPSPSYMPCTHGDSTHVPRRSDRQAHKRPRPEDSAYGTHVGEMGSPQPP